ncbi:MAG: EFR1 family ferrodoxin [Lachnospiraceae bacterium]|nr:EFR1 family ferrodoxin [Lachnospiraceae bacterium]
MIFYFTGTGNSLYVAKRILGNDEKLINIADAINNNEFEYSIGNGESVGFIFPVYFYTVPEIVRNFIAKTTIVGAEYIYAVITCGVGISQSGAVLNKLLKEKGLNLSYVEPLLMPDNSMLFYQIPSLEENCRVLDNAEKIIMNIKSDINKHEKRYVGNNTFASDFIGISYKLCLNTKKFYADEKCVGCGLCERICPQKVIELNGGKPHWTKKKCSKCSACINRCPKSAIQFGRMTKNRNRYANPEL